MSFAEFLSEITNEDKNVVKNFITLTSQLSESQAHNLDLCKMNGEP